MQSLWNRHETVSRNGKRTTLLTKRGINGLLNGDFMSFLGLIIDFSRPETWEEFLQKEQRISKHILWFISSQGWTILKSASFYTFDVYLLCWVRVSVWRKVVLKIHSWMEKMNRRTLLASSFLCITEPAHHLLYSDKTYSEVVKTSVHDIKSLMNTKRAKKQFKWKIYLFIFEGKNQSKSFPLCLLLFSAKKYTLFESIQWFFKRQVASSRRCSERWGHTVLLTSHLNSLTFTLREILHSLVSNSESVASRHDLMVKLLAIESHLPWR